MPDEEVQGALKGYRFYNIGILIQQDCHVGSLAVYASAKVGHGGVDIAEVASMPCS